MSSGGREMVISGGEREERRALTHDNQDKWNKLILLPTSFLDMYKLKLFCIVVLFCFDYIYLHVLNKCLNQSIILFVSLYRYQIPNTIRYTIRATTGSCGSNR